MNYFERIDSLMQQALMKCLSYCKEDASGKCFYVDPIDKVEISAHYGNTHAAAAFILLGDINNDKKLYEKGVVLLNNILDRWNINTMMSGFHFDFNNFALCIAAHHISDPILVGRIKKVVCETSDSKHLTINWLPMRVYVNLMRYSWTGKVEYCKLSDKFLNIISKAINSDGGIEDRLPKGTSFNLQYDVSTVAELNLLNNIGVHRDLSMELGFLIKVLNKDGDINYLGRGCNQIFAWGPWIYLLASSGNIIELNQAIDYLSAGQLLSNMLKNDNLLLNNIPGINKMWWWDYHYASVYIAHFLLWLALAKRDCGKNPIIPAIPSNLESSGLHIVQNSDCQVIWFDGRSEYLSERGPAISSIWTRKNGNIFKGFFGSWGGLFGNNYSDGEMIFLNFLGLVEYPVENAPDNILGRVRSRFNKGKSKKYGFTIKPYFAPINVKVKNETVEISWSLREKVNAFLNAPLSSNMAELDLIVDGQAIPLLNVGEIHNQYGLRHVYHSHGVKGRQWILRIRY